MSTDKDDTILARWLAGELTDKEAQALLPEENLGQLASKLEKIKAFDYPKATGEELWERMGEKILATPKTPAEPMLRRRLWPRIAGVAASFLLLLSLFWWMQQLKTSLLAGQAEHPTQTWEDGSFAQLNAGSQLDWNADWTTERRLKLDGEAFFSVAKGRPFTVNTPLGKVEVLGTEFNVLQRKERFEVICYEGKVRVTTAGTEVILTPGEGITFKGNETSPIAVSTAQPAWRNGQTTFNKVALAEAFAELERQFNITLQLETTIDDRVYTGQFPHNDLTKALRLVCQPMQLGFDQQGANIRIFEE